MDNTLERVVNSWHQRAIVRLPEFSAFISCDSKEGFTDYPIDMVPFWGHPLFEQVDETARQSVLTLAWLIFNERTISAEEHIANPAFTLVFRKNWSGLNNYQVRVAMQQAMVDEHFHTLMHVNAIENTRRHHNITTMFTFPYGTSYRRFKELESEQSAEWQRNLLLLTFALVSEVSINAYLDVMAKNETIQPSHAKVAEWHNRDEYAHAKICIEVMKLIVPEFSKSEWTLFLSYLPKAMAAFAAQDYSAWKYILDYLKITKNEQIIADCQQNHGDDRFVRDFSGIKQVAQELDILDCLDAMVIV